jgi:hypothetical protein
MNAGVILLIGSFMSSVITLLKNISCGVNNEPNTCNNIFSILSCMLCIGVLIMLFTGTN